MYMKRVLKYQHRWVKIVLELRIKQYFCKTKQQSKYNFIQTKCFVIGNVMQVEMYQKYN